MPSLQWMDDALCREVGHDLFFPETGQNPTEAKRVCKQCPVQAECLEYALTSPFAMYGVLGGTTENERRALKRRRTA